MEFDFSAAIKAANAAVERQESTKTQSYAHPLVYPQAGQTITIRPLFNPKSGQIIRLINRHEKVACYRTYGVDCPICNVQQQVKDMTGQDPFGRTKRSRTRGICFAQYISSTNQIDKGNDQGIVRPGEIILFMFPWSVYNQINTTIAAIAQTPTGMDQAFCHAQSGLYLQITVSADFNYTTTTVPYMTFPTNQTDEEFMKSLNDLEDLSEQVLPSKITDEVNKQVSAYVDEIYRQFINPKVPNQAPQETPTPTTVNEVPTNQVPFSGAANPQQVNFSTAPISTPTQSQPKSAGIPQCFGKHQENSPQCICCPEELKCIEASDNVPF